VSAARQRTQRRAQREATRRQILEAADSFLREHPFREISLDAVMAQTGLTRTAFYRHFDDVPELVLQLLADVGGELYGLGVSWLEQSEDDFAAATRHGIDGIVGFFERHGPLVRAVADAAGVDEQIERGYGAFLDAFDELIARGLDRLVTSGRIEPGNTRALARALNLMNERYLLDVFGREPYGDADAARETLTRIWVRAVGVVS
jgi:AcrR family transcriptional regulator